MKMMYKVLMAGLCFGVGSVQGSDLQNINQTFLNAATNASTQVVAAQQMVMLRMQELMAKPDAASFFDYCVESFGFRSVSSADKVDFCLLDNRCLPRGDFIALQAEGLVWAQGNMEKLALLNAWLEIQHIKLGLDATKCLFVPFVEFKHGQYSLARLFMGKDVVNSRVDAILDEQYRELISVAKVAIYYEECFELVRLVTAQDVPGVQAFLQQQLTTVVTNIDKMRAELQRIHIPELFAAAGGGEGAAVGTVGKPRRGPQSRHEIDSSPVRGRRVKNAHHRQFKLFSDQAPHIHHNDLKSFTEFYLYRNKRALESEGLLWAQGDEQKAIFLKQWLKYRFPDAYRSESEPAVCGGGVGVAAPGDGDAVGVVGAGVPVGGGEGFGGVRATAGGEDADIDADTVAVQLPPYADIQAGIYEFHQRQASGEPARPQQRRCCTIL